MRTLRNEVRAFKVGFENKDPAPGQGFANLGKEPAVEVSDVEDQAVAPRRKIIYVEIDASRAKVGSDRRPS